MKLNTADSLFGNYKKMLIGKFYKILPMIEEENPTVLKHVDSFLFELYGLKKVFNKMENNGVYVVLLSTLESINEALCSYDFDTLDYERIRREILKCISIVNKLSE